jgi:hypothetical protein
MDSKRVFILGAGFSKQAGMPLATELTPLLRRKFEEYNHEEALEWLAWLDERISWLKQTDENATPSLNIEELFDLAHFDALTFKLKQHMCPVGRNAGDTPYSDAEAIEAWLSYMEDDLRDVIWDKQKAGLEKLDRIARFTDLLREQDTVVTFNYDTLIEQSLSQAEKPWHYGFKIEKGQGTQIVKMHGSINWAIVLREQVGNFEYPLLFKKEDKNRLGTTTQPTGEAEYDYALLRIPDDKLANRIENRILQRGDKQYGIGIAGLGRYKPLDKMPGSGQVWHNAGRALYQADEIYVIGFSLSPFDTMAQLHFAGVMCERAGKKNLPSKVVLIDPYARERLANFRAVFGPDVRIEPIQQPAEQVDWNVLLGK